MLLTEHETHGRLTGRHGTALKIAGNIVKVADQWRRPRHDEAHLSNRRPVSEQAKWQPRRSRREQILVAARELFETKGFHSVTVNDIGQSLGMRGPSIYRHFASKRELLAAAWDREATRFVAGTLDALRDARSPDDALGLLAASIAQVLVGSEALIRMTYLDLDDDPEYVGSWVAWRPFVVEVWCDVLAEIRDDLSDPEVRFIVEMTHATMVQAANDAAGRPTWVDEIANLGVALATARPPDR